jgi:ACR3 family arsenite transporter
VVGVLIEVPVMLLVVGVVNRSQRWYEGGLSPKGTVPGSSANSTDDCD